MFLERQEQLKRRAIIGQLHPNDLELLEQIERIILELYQLAKDIKEFNNK